MTTSSPTQARRSRGLRHRVWALTAGSTALFATVFGIVGHSSTGTQATASGTASNGSASASGVSATAGSAAATTTTAAATTTTTAATSASRSTAVPTVNTVTSGS